MNHNNNTDFILHPFFLRVLRVSVVDNTISPAKL